MSITPYLYYEDTDTAMRFLSEAFGLKRYGRPSRGPEGRVNHAAMQLGDGVVMMGSPQGRYRNPKNLKQATQSLYVDVDDVDKHYRKAVRAGAKIIEEPHNTNYTQRRYGAEDPEGHQWYFAQLVR